MTMKSQFGMLASIAMIMNNNMDMNPTTVKAGYIHIGLPFTRKQRKARAKSKRAKQARKINYRQAK